MTKKKTKKPQRPPADKLRTRAIKGLEFVREHAESVPGGDLKICASLAGEEAPPKEAFQASMIEPRVRAATVVAEETWQHFQGEVLAQPGIITIALPVSTGPDHICFNALRCRKIKGDLKNSGIANAIGTYQLRSRPADNDYGCEIHPVLKLLVYGENVGDEAMVDLQRRLEKRFYVGSDQLMKYQLLGRTEEAIAVTATQLFDMSEGNAKGLAKQAKMMGLKGWKKRRPLRELCRFQALASVQFKAMCFAIGDGERQLDKAIVEGKHLLKPLWKQEQVLHRDQIAQFTAAELVRLGL